MRKLLTQLLFLSAASLGIQPLFGQGAADTSKGAMSVEVKDAMLATVPDAKVTVEGPLGTANATTDTRGMANFASLAPGAYTVTVTKNGFSAAKVTDLN